MNMFLHFKAFMVSSETSLDFSSAIIVSIATFLPSYFRIYLSTFSLSASKSFLEPAAIWVNPSNPPRLAVAAFLGDSDPFFPISVFFRCSSFVSILLVIFLVSFRSSVFPNSLNSRYGWSDSISSELENICLSCASNLDR